MDQNHEDPRVAAIVILEGLAGHKHFEPLVAAARQTGTPLAYGDTAGTGALRKAFSEIEQKLNGLVIGSLFGMRTFSGRSSAVAFPRSKCVA